MYCDRKNSPKFSVTKRITESTFTFSKVNIHVSVNSVKYVSSDVFIEGVHCEPVSNDYTYNMIKSVFFDVPRFIYIG